MTDLSKSIFDQIRSGVVRNPKIPLDLLRNLAKDESEIVRFEIAALDYAPVDILCKLIKDESVHVRNVTLSHPNLPKEVKVLYNLFKSGQTI